MNIFIGSGRLTKDPEVKYTQTGKAFCSFTIAIDEYRNDKKITQFVPIVTWGKTAEAAGNNLAKGQMVTVEGKIQVRQYEAKDGQKRYVTEILTRSLEFGAKAKGAAPVDNGGILGQAVEDEEIPF